MKVTFWKKSFVLTALIAIVFCLSVIAVNAEGTDPDVENSTIHVIVENMTFEMEPFYGRWVDTDVQAEAGMTMMDAVRAALDAAKIRYEGADTNYISSINNLSEGDAASTAGWMGTLNDWFVNQGFQNFSVEAGDEIRVMYTVDGGSDVGSVKGDADNKDTSLESIVFGDGIGTLSPAFSGGTHAYELTLPDDVDGITVNPSAANKNFQVRIYKGENPSHSGAGYKRTEIIPVVNDDVITVVCGSYVWPSMSKGDGGTTYTFKIKSNVLKNTKPELIGAKEESEEIQLKGENNIYTLNLGDKFRDADEGDTLTYCVSINGGEKQKITESIYNYKPEAGGNYSLVFFAYDGKEQSEAYRVNLLVKDGVRYSINFLESDGITTDKTEAEVGETVTVTVSKKGEKSNVYWIEYFEIKAGEESVEKKITSTPEDEYNSTLKKNDYTMKRIYTFVMPAHDVSITALWGTKAQIEISAYSISKWVGKLEVTDKYGELVRVRIKAGVSGEMWYLDLAEGPVTYKVYAKNGDLMREGEKDVSKATKSWKFFYVDIETETYLLPYNYQHGIIFEMWEDGQQIYGYGSKPVTTGGKPMEGYRSVGYLLEYNSELSSDVSCRYKISCVDPRVGAEVKIGNTSVEDEGTFKIDNDFYYNGWGSVFKNDNDAYFTITCRLKIKDVPFQCKAPKGANLKAYTHPDVAYAAWKEIDAQIDTSNASYDLYTFKTVPGEIEVVAGGDNTDYIKTYQTYKVENNDTQAELSLAKKGSSQDWREVDNSLYTNIEDEGSYLVMKNGETQKLEAFRTFQTVSNAVVNRFIEPEMHYRVISGDSVTISEKMGSEGREYVELKADESKTGISVIEITYDACQSGPYYYDKISDANKGILIVNVGGNADSIQTGINLLKYDTVYFMGTMTHPNNTTVESAGYGTYTFKPAASGTVKVRTHKPLHLDSDFSNNWKEYTASSDGSYTIDIYNGRNIIEISSGNAVRYFVLNARETDVTVKNTTNPGEGLQAGDTAAVSFSNLSLPIQKMAGIYNPGYPDKTYLVSQLTNQKSNESVSLEGTHTQYSIATNNTITFEVEAGDYLLEKGYIHAQHLGSKLDTHCVIPMEGMGRNFNAESGSNSPQFSILPDVSISVSERVVPEPENPENPDKPDEPMEPDKPDNPDKPENPDKPDNPNNPDNSGQNTDSNGVTTLTYKNYPISVKGKGLEGCELMLTALTADDADVKLMQKQISSSKALIRLYDVKLYKNGVECQPEGTVELSFQVGTQYNGQTLTILHVVDGSVENLRGTVADGKVTVSVNHFSKFGVVVSESSVTTDTGTLTNNDPATTSNSSRTAGVQTGDTAPTALYLFLMLGASGGAICLWSRMKGKKEEDL